MAAALLPAAVPGFSQTRPYDPDEGTLSSIRPKIPEPMVFDLVRPLGAKKGEFEVNSLFRYRPSERPARLLWAPEVEYTFLDGYGIEFELPMENARVETLKGAIQGTLPGPWEKRFIQGWQAIGEVSRESNLWQVDLLYLAGARLRRQWSAFSMTGLRREGNQGATHAFLGNYSIFFHLKHSVTYGLESNIKGKGREGRSLMLMPQIHLRSSRYNVQFGIGSNREARKTSLQLAWRISREF